MCFNYQVSLLTFLICTGFSILLIKKGNIDYKDHNTIAGTFFIFIGLIQFMDFLLWIDIKNKIGINKITTIFGAILNVAQPIILYLIKYFYYKPNIFSMKDYNLPIAILNLIYLIYFINFYIKFLLSGNLTTSTKNKLLKWPWIKYSSRPFYLILLAINIFYLTPLKYSILLFTITYSLLIISYKYFNSNIGEIWCFFGAFIPLIMYYLSFYIDKIIPFKIY